MSFEIDLPCECLATVVAFVSEFVMNGIFVRLDVVLIRKRLPTEFAQMLQEIYI